MYSVEFYISAAVSLPLGVPAAVDELRGVPSAWVVLNAAAEETSALMEERDWLRWLAVPAKLVIASLADSNAPIGTSLYPLLAGWVEGSAGMLVGILVGMPGVTELSDLVRPFLLVCMPSTLEAILEIVDINIL